MKNCPQTKTQSVYDHGLSVWEHTKKLIKGDFENFKLPDWFKDNHREIVNNLHKIDIVKQYNIFHDCGKPYCIEYDSEGKKHFPNHAQISSQIYSNFISDNKDVEFLILNDMALHTSTAKEIENMNLDKKTSFTLLITALAEIHSNAGMFGGIDSTSFKIKWKKLNKRGKQLIKIFCEEKPKEYSYIITRQDLPNPQKAVQGTHAAIEYFNNNGFNKSHPSLVYVVVKNEFKLQKLMDKLLENSINFNIFREPSYENSITAICTESLDELDIRRDILKRYMLLQ